MAATAIIAAGSPNLSRPNKEHSVAIQAQSPVPTINADITMNASGSLNNNSTKPQRVLGFLRKRSSPTSAGLTERDRVKSMVIPSTTSPSSDLFVSPPNSTPNNMDSPPGIATSQNPIKDMIRRKSVELGRLLDGNAGTPTNPRRSSSNNNSRASLDQETFQEKRPTIAMHERGVSNMELSRSASPLQSSTTSSSPAPTLQSRRAAFSLGLPWRPQSEYSTNGLTKAQRRFIRVFPELADLVMVPSAYCAPCMSTPPLTPPASIISSSNSVSPSNTLNTFSSSEYSATSSSTTSMSILSCPGHFDDFACALEREILWQGTLFVTATHICFYGKQFGKTVKVMIDYRDLVSIEKEKKMGVFPSSIRIRTRQTAAAGSPVSPREQEDQVPSGGSSSSEEEPIIKDYVLTSLISREQAYAIMERNWTMHKQVWQNPTGLETPQTEMSDLEGQATDMFSLDLEARVRSGGLRDKRRITPRTYSVVTDEAFSSSENIDRPSMLKRRSLTRLRPSTPTTTDQQPEPWTTGSDDKREIGSSSSSSESRRGSVASSSSAEKQENGLIGFIQKRRSGQLKQLLQQQQQQQQQRKEQPDGSSPQPDGSLEQQEIIIQNNEIIYPSPPISSPISAVAMEPSLSSSSLRGSNGSVDLLRSCTPPLLISPSLTTTKVSHSSSTVQSLARDGSQEMSVHTRKISTEALKGKVQNASNSSINVADPAGTSTSTPTLTADQAPVSTPTPAPVLPSGPVSCGCQRHYKHAVTSVVIPLPLELCFEILFSAKGAGEGSKLTWDTHRIKDGSTEIKFTPWQDGESKTSSPWENQQRNLEYSVTFKMPMLAKTSTACYETQQVIQYQDFLILVHSESKTPNVPYGEHFSTVNQICMTWESPGKTRVKCFTEVKFKKSVMWSSKVESGSLEGSGGFYKEFVRQLHELSESQGEQLIAQFVVSSSQVKQPTAVSETVNDSTPAATASEGRQAINVKPSSEGVPSSLLSPESSRAQSLLAQQIQRNASATAGSSTPTRLSLDTVRPVIELSTSTTFSTTTSSIITKDQMTPTTPVEKKSTLTMLLSSLTAPGFPMLSSATAGAFAYDAKNSAGVTNKDSPSMPSTPITPTEPVAPPPPPAMWGDFLRRGLTFFVAKSVQQDVSSASRLVGKNSDSSDSNSSTRSSDSQQDGNRVKFALPATRKSFAGRSSAASTAVRPSASVPSLRDQRHQQQQQQQQHQYYEQPVQGVQQQQQNLRDGNYIFLSRAFFMFVVLGMVVTALNIWHLHTVVSSIVEVVHQRQDMFMQYPSDKNPHHHNHNHHDQKHQPSKQYQNYDQYDQYDEYDQYHSYEPYVSHGPYSPHRRYDRSHRHHNQHYYYPKPQHQQWKSRKEYDDLDHESSSPDPTAATAHIPNAEPLSPLSNVHEEQQVMEPGHQSQQDQSQTLSQLELKLETVQAIEKTLMNMEKDGNMESQYYREMISNEINVVAAKLDQARKELEQAPSVE
ncbi:hypothetical protein BGX27_005658 [Mortierella sp. AM989]|nr:hypothetical protein BGX27_005658 [Mortierella sp. AM989]